MESAIEVGECIGVGSSARVLKGQFGNAAIAIKMYTSPYRKDIGLTQLLEKEVSVLLTVPHPNSEFIRVAGTLHVTPTLICSPPPSPKSFDSMGSACFRSKGS
jgi:hypothetical protein